MKKQPVKRLLSVILATLFVVQMVTVTTAIPVSAETTAVAYVDFNEHSTTVGVAPSWTEGAAPAGRVRGDGLSVSQVGDSVENTMTQRGDPAQWGMERKDFIFVFVDNSVLKTTREIDLEIEYWRTNSPNSIEIEYVSTTSSFQRVTANTEPGDRFNNNWNIAKVRLANCNFTGTMNQNAQFRISSSNVIIKSIRMTEVPIDDAGAVERAKEDLTWRDIAGANLSQSKVASNLVLPVTGQYGTSVSWLSSNPDVISNTGIVTVGAAPTPVTLTATISRGDVSDVKIFSLTVTVGAVGSADLVLTGIPGPIAAEGKNPNFAGGSGSSGHYWQSAVDGSYSHIESGGQVGYLGSDVMIRYPNVNILGGIDHISVDLAKNGSANRTFDVYLTEPGQAFTGIANTANNAAKIATMTVNATTGGWSNYVTYHFDDVSLHEGGVKDVYIRLRGGNLNYGGLSLWLKPLDDAAAIEAAAKALVWDDFKGANYDMDGVSMNLRLPSSGAFETGISWSSSNPDVISVTGVVARVSENTIVTLTAAISKNGLVYTKDFVLTVVPGSGYVGEVFIDFNNPDTFSEVNEIGSGFGDGGDPQGKNPGLQGNGIGISLVGDGNNAVARVRQSGVDAVRVGNFIYVIVDEPDFADVNIVDLEIKWWRPSAANGISLEYNTIYPGNFSGFEAYRGASIPTAGSGQSWVTSSVRLNGANFAVGAQNQGAHFRINTKDAVIQSIRITEVSPSDGEAVRLASEALVWNTIKKANATQTLVQTDLNLPSAGANRTSIEWISSAPAIVAADGKVTRPNESTAVVLTAVLTKGGSSAEKTFNLNIRGTGADVPHGTALANAKAALTWDVIRRSNIYGTSVITDLNLPATGANYTNITWSSSNNGRINAETGVVTRHAADSANVTLTATISRETGEATEEVVFNLTVPALNDITANVRPSIQTVYPTKDYVAADYIVTDFGAKTVEQAEAEGLVDFCNREAFQAAIDAAYNNSGGVVWIPAGNYAFYTTAGASTTVTINQSTGERETYAYERVLNLRTGVQLRGDWADPEGVDKNGNPINGKVFGTILEVYAGHNSPNSDGYAKGQRVDPQAGNAVRDTYISIADRFIDMDQGTGVTNLSIWYPKQSIESGEAIPYPWTLYQRGGDSATVENVTLVNSYGGFYSSPSELHYVLNSYMTSLYTGIEIHICTDIGRVENIKIDPKYWAESGLPGSPSYADARNFTRTKASGFRMHRSDWEYVSYLYVSGYKVGTWVGKEPGYTDTPNAQFYEIHVDDCGIAFEVEDVNPYGLLISNSDFAGDIAAYFDNDFHTSVQFNGVDFNGPIVSDGKSGVISFENCKFDGYGNYTINVDRTTVGGNTERKYTLVPIADGTGYALKLNSGSVLLGQSEFAKPDAHVWLGANVNTLKSVNSGYNWDLAVTNTGRPSAVQVVTGAQYECEPIPQDIKTDIDAHPKAARDLVLRADLTRRTGNNNTMPTVDVSADLQKALDYVKSLGGGIVYLPSGRYLLNQPIVVPTGVELRGSFDVPHHTVGGGTQFITNYVGDVPNIAETNISVPNGTRHPSTNTMVDLPKGTTLGGTGRSLIQLEAGSGIRGITIAQDNIGVKYGPSFREGNNGEYVYVALDVPYLIQGQGADVYIVNVNIPYGDKGIDLATYKTDNHYVDYLSGQLARVGILVGNGAEGGYIRNLQFNPHYGLRFAPGTQSIRRVDLYEYQIYNYSSIKIGDVKNETIFNNFVFGAQYGIHFAKDTANNNYPGEITVIGHGTDGGTFGMYVQDGDAATKIILINTELVSMTTPTEHRSFVMMGDFNNPGSVAPEARLIMYNSAFWGSPSEAVIIQNGIVRMQQTNFCSAGNPSLLVYGGRAHVYDSYFQGGNRTHAKIEAASGSSVELTNNYYANNAGVTYTTNTLGGVYGSDLGDVPPVTLEIVDKQLKLTNAVIGASLSGTITLTAPSQYAADFTPLKFDSLTSGQSITMDLPYYGADRLVFAVKIANREYSFELFLNSIYAEYLADGENFESLEGETPALITDETHYFADPRPWAGTDDLSMAGRVKWDEENLYLYLKVTDKKHFNPQTNSGDIWNGDGIQIGLNMDMNRGNPSWPQANEIGFAVNNFGTSLKNRWMSPSGSDFESVDANITRDDDAKLTVYKVIIPWEALYSPGFEPSKNLEGVFDKLGLSILVNNTDDGSRNSGLEYGIGVNFKSYNSLSDLYLMKPGQYDAMLAESAKAAVKKALATGSVLDTAMARNFIAVVTDEKVKAELNELLVPSSVKLVSATPSAYVTKLNGNKNELVITVKELYSDGTAVDVTKTFLIDNNSAGTYNVGEYKVYVNTKGNTQIREIYIVR